MIYSTYILYSESADKYYVGSTNNLEDRIYRHNSGYNKYTKHGVPWKIMYFEEFDTRSGATSREYEIKSKKSRKYIEWLISSGE